jgi:glycosyltransferase involved in cell wall biosynthesis
MYGGCYFSTKKLISIIKKEKPDVVQIHCINGYFVNVYKLIEFLKKSHIKTVLTLHAEFMHTANCAHAYDCEKWKSGCGKCPSRRQETKSLFFDRTHTSWNRMKRAFEGFENDLMVVSVSPWLMERAKQSPILEKKKHTVIYNGLDTNVFQPYNIDELKEKHGITNEKIIFHATPDFSQATSNLKGGHFVVEMAKRMKDENVRFIVAGSYNKSIEYPKNMILLGKVADQELLAKYYSMADVTLLTSKRETFSMVCAESFCCGTPVVGFKAGAQSKYL